MPSVDPRTGEVPRFSTFLANHGRGVADQELTDRFAELLQACQTLDKAGVLTVKVKAKPEGGGLVLSVASVLNAPTPDPAAQFYFRDPDTGMPTRRDPNQPSLPGVDDDVDETADA